MRDESSMSVIEKFRSMEYGPAPEDPRESLLWLDRQGWIRPGGLAEQPRSYFVLIALVCAGFIIISPLTYGFSVDGYDEWLAAFVRSWR